MVYHTLRTGPGDLAPPPDPAERRLAGHIAPSEIGHNPLRSLALYIIDLIILSRKSAISWRSFYQRGQPALPLAQIGQPHSATHWPRVSRAMSRRLPAVTVHHPLATAGHSIGHET